MNLNSESSAADVVPPIPRRGMLDIPARVAKRAATRVIPDENGCLISTYSVASHGYAQIGWQSGGHNHGTLCHRAAWVYHHRQQIPDGMTIDHICKNRRCVNPDHLRILPNFENARRIDGADWPVGVCKHGHSNKYLAQYSGRWHCSICHERWQSKGIAKTRARRRSTKRNAA